MGALFGGAAGTSPANAMWVKIAGALGLPGGSTGSTTGNPTSGLGGILGSVLSGLHFADGGEPPMGQAWLVGELGPELFVPKRAGTLVPNKSWVVGRQSTTPSTHVVRMRLPSNSVSVVRSYRSTVRPFASG